MSIVNRRNAILGWATWQIAKRAAAQKARSAVPSVDSETRRPNKSAIVAALAAGAAVLLFWRRKGDEPVIEE